MVPGLEFRRIGVRSGAMPYGRSNRVKRNSLLRLRGGPEAPAVELPRWVTLKQAVAYYRVRPTLNRSLIAHQQLKARRIGDSKAIRIDRIICRSSARATELSSCPIGRLERRSEQCAAAALVAKRCCSCSSFRRRSSPVPKGTVGDVNAKESWIPRSLRNRLTCNFF
jgi:hypothetical protein